ncbi:MAG: magnesium chelatase domain-containing protein, partial [Dehalococcoidia bacterium]
MLSKVNSCAVVGLAGEIVEVEVDISRGLPAFAIVGLPDTAVQEAKERVRSAIRNSGHNFPQQRITVNLAPADLRKEGPAYDLPIAVGILLASGQVPPPQEPSIFLGELSLDGRLRHTHGILAMVGLARDRGFGAVYVPEADVPEASLIEGVEVFPVETLNRLAEHLRAVSPITPVVGDRPGDIDVETPRDGVDFQHIKGQEHVKRALEVAAAGGHNVLMVGPPGAGKTLLARATPTILAQMTGEEALDVTRIYSVAGMLP